MPTPIFERDREGETFTPLCRMACYKCPDYDDEEMKCVAGKEVEQVSTLPKARAKPSTLR